MFISWSGKISKDLAHILRDWLPTVIQAADPFVSDNDIHAGARSLQAIAYQLQSCKIGILCVTSGNQGSAWLNFEAGALSKAFEKDYVIPIAFNLEKGQIKNPLGQFQAKYCSEEDMMSVVRSVNRALDAPLNEQRLRTAFELAWEKFDGEASRLKEKAEEEDEAAPRETEDMFSEIVELLRGSSSSIAKLLDRNSKIPGWSAQTDAANDAVRRLSELYSGGENVLSMSDIVTLAPNFDTEDWKIVETAPFVLWYLTEYHNVRRSRREQADSGDIDKIPF